MYIKNIYLNKFRNFESANTIFSPQINFFLGPNGQGKTNLLEAMYVLIKGHSFRYSHNDSFMNHNLNTKEHFKSESYGKYLSEITDNKTFLRSEFSEGELVYKLQLIIDEKSKTFIVNQKKISSLQIQKKFHVVLFSPESLSFIKESSELRRELIDDFIGSINPKNIDIISDYRKALKTRNKLLKENKDGKIEAKNFYLVFESINELFIKKAAALTFERIRAIKEIRKDLNDHMQYISQNNVDIFVDYFASNESYLGFSYEEIEKKLIERFKTLEIAEISSGTSLVGPHKHEIVFLYNQKDSRIFCSQGQQRAIILSFKMAQIVYHRRTHGWYPVLMLDDVLSELDNEKKRRLISFLEKINTQIFITATELDDELRSVLGGNNCGESNLTQKNHKIIHISQGKILE